ncbi:MAG: YARHG domain-containing protein [Spirochaetia bacterium]|nr:YARHG domain-containing protein [Spirochaetia bacterium]
MRKIFIIIFFFSNVITGLIAIENIKSIIDKAKNEEKNEITYNIIKNGEIQYLKERLSYLSLALLNKEELKILRNTIFAQYGYNFRTPKIKKHFEQFYWYRPNNNEDIDIENNFFSKIDEENIKKIKTFEEINENIENIIEAKDIIGVWHSTFPMPAGFNSRFVFYEDNTFVYVYSTMREMAEIHSFSGKYFIKGNSIRLEMNIKNNYENSKDIEFTFGYGYQYKNSKIKEIKYKKPIIYKLPITKPRINKKYKFMEIYIGDSFFYHHSKKPEIKY